MKRKRCFTLLEIMIVIFLIGLIGGVIGINMKKSLEEGKAFKTKQAIQQIEDILNLKLAEGAITKKQVEENYARCMRKWGYAKDLNAVTKDGWGGPFIVTVDVAKNEVQVVSQAYNDYLVKKGQKRSSASGGSSSGDEVDSDDNEQD